MQVKGARSRPAWAASTARSVLVVEDDRELRSLFESVLADQGYDVRTAMRPFKEYVATYLEYQAPLLTASGYAEEAARATELLEAGRFDDAVEAIPDDFIDAGWLCGPIAFRPKRPRSIRRPRGFPIWGPASSLSSARRAAPRASTTSTASMPARPACGSLPSFRGRHCAGR